MLAKALIVFLFISAVEEPKAVIAGPAKKRIGRAVIIKTKGTIGDDLKVECSPTNSDWYVVNFADGSIGIIFETENPGNYAFAVAANKNGKTAVAIHMVEIFNPVPPGPGPGPAPNNPLAQAINDSFKTDLAAGVGSLDDKKQLSANYSIAIKTLIPNCKTLKELQDDMKDMNDHNLKGRLPNVRQVIAAYLITNLGTNPADPVAKAIPLWQAISEALK